MPRRYKRKEGVRPRVVSWTTEELQAAFDEIEKKTMGINAISRKYGIPSRTLRRRYANQNKTPLTLGKHPTLGFDNEKRLVKHILKLGDAGFPPDRRAIRMLAYQFAEKLQLKHNFDHETQMAGKAWFMNFMERNPELSIRQAEGLSVARAKGLCRERVNQFYELLTKVLTENDLLDKPERIYNMDETGVQLNNKPGKVITKKGTKVVNSVTCAEKGETMTVVACCNAIGNFLAPVIIIKGVNKKPEFEQGLPLGSKVYMNKKSAYVNSELFFKWLKDHFIPHKPQGKVVLILDGHSSHSTAPDMLQVAADNDVILLCLPSHTTSALQPLDVAVFGPLKTYFNQETNHFMRTHPNKKISRYNAGQLICNAWVRATTPANALGGFRGSGIYPLNPNALPDSAFLISDIALGRTDEPHQPYEVEVRTQTPLPQTNQTPYPLNHQPELESRTPTPLPQTSQTPSPLNHQPELEARTPTPLRDTSSMMDCQPEHVRENIPGPSQNKTPPNQTLNSFDRETPSFVFDPEVLENITIPDFGDEALAKIIDSMEKETPSKILVQASPIPQIPLTISKRATQSADILNSRDKIKQKTDNAEKKAKQIKTKLDKTNKTETTKEKGNPIKTNKGTKDKQDKTKKKGKPKKLQYTSEEDDVDVTDFSDKENDSYSKLNRGRGSRKRKIIYSSNSESENSPNNSNKTKDNNTKGKKTKGKKTKGLPVKKTKKDKQENSKETDDNQCIECFDSYANSKSKSDWIQCISCQKWLHELCTLFRNYCSKCGKIKTRTNL